MTRITAARGPLTIGHLSGSTGVHRETIRYYERTGLLPQPPRSAGRHRLNDDSHRQRLAFIRRGRELGFALEEIRTLLQLADGQSRPCAEARGIAARHLDQVRAKIGSLRAMERTLAGIVARCAEAGPPGCPLLDALQEDSGQNAT